MEDHRLLPCRCNGGHGRHIGRSFDLPVRGQAPDPGGPGERSLDPTANTGQVITNIGQQRETEVKSELEILKSQDLIEKVVDAIGPSAFLNPPEDSNGTSQKNGSRIKEWIVLLVGRVGSLFSGLFNQLSDRDQAILVLTKSLEMDAPKTSNIITINFETKSRKLAQETINKLIGFYLDKHITVHNTPGSFEFFTKETDQFREALAKKEENLKELKNRTGVASIEEQRRHSSNKDWKPPAGLGND